MFLTIVVVVIIYTCRDVKIGMLVNARKIFKTTNKIKPFEINTMCKILHNLVLGKKEYFQRGKLALDIVE